jgi:large subunit ribosomal protein L25
VSEVRIKAEPRTEFGKGGARRTRRAGNVPAVLYGHGEAPRHIALPAREFAAAIRHGGMTQLFSIEITGGGETLALPKAIQRDPIKDSFDHVDLLVVRRGEKVTVSVPVHLLGEAARETLVNQEHQTISIIADATALPDHLEVSIQGLDAGDRVTAGQVKLPEGVELEDEPDMIVAMVHAATVADLGEVEEPEEAEEGVEGGEAEGGADAAPAAEADAA